MKRFFFLAAVALIGLAMAWSVYWWTAADEMRAAVNGWIEDWRARGYQVDHGELRIGGFPLSVQAELPFPFVADPGEAWSWQAEAIVLRTRLWEPTRYRISVPGEQAATIPVNGRPVAMTILSASTTIEASFTIDGRLETGALAIDDLKGLAPDIGASVSARRIAVDLALPDVDPVTYEDPAGEVTLIVDALTLPSAWAGPLGRDMERLSVRLQALGPLRRGDLREVLGKWRDGGGIVEVPWLRGRWGPLTVEASGTLALDEAFRPLAAFKSELGGFNPTLDAFVDAGMVDPRGAKLVKLGLALLSSISSSGGSVIKLPVSIQDGEVYFGPVAVARVRPIFPVEGADHADDEPPPPKTAPVPPPVEELPLLEEPPTVEWQ